MARRTGPCGVHSCPTRSLLEQLALISFWCNEGISRQRVGEISARFVSLNPYDRRLVSESILKMETVNDDSSGEPRALLGFAISAKRYALLRTRWRRRANHRPKGAPTAVARDFV